MHESDMTAPATTSNWAGALPFWMSLALIPLVFWAGFAGGLWVLLVPVVTWYLFSALDAVLGQNLSNADPETPDSALGPYRAITLVWAPLQFIMLFGLIWLAQHGGHLTTSEKIGLFFGVGVITGTVGINYAHELMHQKPRIERNMADLLLAMVLYSHFRSEHMLVHHRYVATPRDTVTARYNEGFHRFYPRVLREGLVSAFGAERDMLARKGKGWASLGNPFWRYWGLQLMMLALAFWVAGAASGSLRCRRAWRSGNWSWSITSSITG